MMITANSALLAPWGSLVRSSPPMNAATKRKIVQLTTLILNMTGAYHAALKSR